MADKTPRPFPPARSSKTSEAAAKENMAAPGMRPPSFLRKKSDTPDDPAVFRVRRKGPGRRGNAKPVIQ